MSTTLPHTRVASQPAGALPFQELPAELAPDRSLLHYYLLASLLFGPFFVIAVVPAYFKYHTLRYELDDEGITMRWGILFRREISLTYARIQDIQLSNNFVERWLGLAKIQLQTASGSSSAEMTIEGIGAYGALRDFLYARMRGARQGPKIAAPRANVIRDGEDGIAALTATLAEVAAELRALRLQHRSGDGDALRAGDGQDALHAGDGQDALHARNGQDTPRAGGDPEGPR